MTCVSQHADAVEFTNNFLSEYWSKLKASEEGSRILRDPPYVEVAEITDDMAYKAATADAAAADATATPSPWPLLALPMADYLRAFDMKESHASAVAAHLDSRFDATKPAFLHYLEEMDLLETGIACGLKQVSTRLLLEAWEYATDAKVG